ncbi:MAG: hypothetical protein M3441_12065 [Chloroflexota bacterium]|nr:hypothetical protein [Chloroflexota bacterium]
MQAITVAIGPTGIDYFARQLLVGDLLKALDSLKPPDRLMGVPSFPVHGHGWSADYSNITINLSNGSLSNFSPVFQSIAQQAGGKFLLNLLSSNFTTNYSWYETYHEVFCTSSDRGPICNDLNNKGTYSYSPSVGKLTTSVVLAFVYNAGTKGYDVNVLSSSGNAENISPNIPARSVIQNEDHGCFTSQVSDTTAKAVSSIDFSGPLAQVIPPMLRSIPGSGHLTSDIVYDFGLGDSGLNFPGDSGLQIGVTGNVTYKGTPYPGTPPTALPLPPVPTDHHLQTYVSDYELNALHWAYFQAGLLDTTVNPSDLPNPDVLKVKTYVTAIPAFKPYASYAMQAHIVPRQPPTITSQQVYIFSTTAKSLLQQQLPASVYQQITGLEGNVYVSQADLESDLAGAEVAQGYYATIEKATLAVGMVVAHDLQFTLTIQNGAPPQQQPNLVFDLVRTDVLQDLGLGISGTAQTLQYAFTPVKYAATFVSTTVPGFDKRSFGDLIWPVVGEQGYDKTLQEMGKTGVPLPIMSGFQFLFNDAQLSIQQGYVSILAKVQFKGTNWRAVLDQIMMQRVYPEAQLQLV